MTFSDVNASYRSRPGDAFRATTGLSGTLTAPMSTNIGYAEVDNNTYAYSAGEQGGGIANWGTLILNGSSQVDGNAASEGGGIYNGYGDVLTVNDSGHVADNTPDNCYISALSPSTTC